MNLLRISSWSLNVKILIILLIAIISINLANVPLNIQTFSSINRQAYQQIVTESALRQKEGIDEDFAFALSIVEEFPRANIPYLSVVQWLTRSDPSTPNFSVEATQAKSAAEGAIEAELLSVAPSYFQQAWLINKDGFVIANPTNFIEPRFDVAPEQYVDVSQSPAHLTGSLIGETIGSEREIDLVVEGFDEELSLQVIVIIKRGEEFVGTLVIELNNNTIILNNMELLGTNNNAYSFVTSPDNSDEVITLPTTSRNLINLDTQATRASTRLQEAQTYPSGNRQVIGYYTPLFDGFRNDIRFVVELDESIALGNIAASILLTTGPNILIEIFLLLIAMFIINRIVTNPIKIITNTIRSINAGDFQSPFPINTSEDEIGELAETVIELRQQLRTLTTDMTTRIEARSRDLQLTQEIGRVAISETDLDRLMNRITQLIVDRFELIYHAQIFLIEGDYAVLKASTGEAGQQLLKRGHRLSIGSLSVIGQVTQQSQTIIARDTAASEIHRRNEFLPRTRAELAIPLRLGSRVLGALDVQSTQRDNFDDDLITILETMADQIAIAIENSRLYKEIQQRLNEFEQSNTVRVQRDWTDFMYTQRAHEIVQQAGAQPIDNFEQLRQQSIQTRQPTIGQPTERHTIPVALPITIRDQVLGVIEWEIPENEFNQNQILLADELASRLAVSLDNARLVQAGRQTTENERIINTITTRISGQTDIEQILQTAIKEVGQALRAPIVHIRLDQKSGNGHSSNGHSQDSSENS